MAGSPHPVFAVRCVRPHADPPLPPRLERALAARPYVGTAEPSTQGREGPVVGPQGGPALTQKGLSGSEGGEGQAESRGKEQGKPSGKPPHSWGPREPSVYNKQLSYLG